MEGWPLHREEGAGQATGCPVWGDATSAMAASERASQIHIPSTAHFGALFFGNFPKLSQIFDYGPHFLSLFLGFIQSLTFPQCFIEACFKRWHSICSFLSSLKDIACDEGRGDSANSTSRLLILHWKSTSISCRTRCCRKQEGQIPPTRRALGNSRATHSLESVWVQTSRWSSTMANYRRTVRKNIL